MHPVFCTHPSVLPHLSCFPVLVNVPSAAMIIQLQLFFKILVFSRSTSRHGIAGSLHTSMLCFLKNLHKVLPSGCTHLHFPATLGGFSSLHAICKFDCRFFEMVILIDVKWYLIGQLNCLSLRTSEAEHFFLRFMAISMPSLEKCAFRSWAIFYWIVCFLILWCTNSWYVLEINSLWVSSFAEKHLLLLYWPHSSFLRLVPENHLLLLHWLCQSLWLCGSQQTLENS